MSEALHRRARAVRSRSAVRAWECRQRAHAKGTWYRLRRLLTFAERAMVVSPEEADKLVAEGFEPDPVGAELAPPKRLLVVPRQRADTLASGRTVQVRLGVELLQARDIVLVPFTSLDDGEPRR